MGGETWRRTGGRRPGGGEAGASRQRRESDPLTELALSAAAGDTTALDELLAAVDEQRLSRPAVRRLIVNDDDAEDVYQDVMIRVARRISSFDGRSKFTTWLHTVARNVAVDHLKRQRDAGPLPDDRLLSDGARLSSMIATRSDVRAMLETLPDHYRAVVELRDMQGRSYDEIARLLGIELNTVRSRLFRARAMLSRSLDR